MKPNSRPADSGGNAAAPSASLSLVAGKPHRPSFSRGLHFALVLVPVVVGVGLSLLEDFLQRAKSGIPAAYTGAQAQGMAWDASGFFHFLVFGMFLLGVGSAIWLLHRVRIDTRDEG